MNVHLLYGDAQYSSGNLESYLLEFVALLQLK